MAGAGPTLGGFIMFVTDVMKPTVYFVPATSPYVSYSYDYALQFVNAALASVPGVTGAWTLYAMAVYNLAADTLINFAQDGVSDPPYPNSDSDTKYWSYLRQQFKINTFIPGVLTSSSDESSSVGYQVSDQFAGYTIANLQNLKTPYGRQYLGIAGSWGTQWGIS
jgi:hypothetical protein